MHTDNLSAWTHDHVFDTGNALAERSTRVVMWITAAAMVIEITAGWWFNSMALLADGWHMSSHAFAIGVSALAYAAARRYAQDRRFAFGTWKIEILGGFASAIFLLGVAAMMVVGSIERIVSPQAIQYREAIAVAILGLAVNLVCALILGRAHHHGHDHHGHVHHDHDHHDSTPGALRLAAPATAPTPRRNALRRLMFGMRAILPSPDRLPETCDQAWKSVAVYRKTPSVAGVCWHHDQP